MSIVVAVMTNEKIIMAGDTQLNDKNGPIKETGMKVFPIGNKYLVGITGDYLTYMKAIDDVNKNRNLAFKGIEALTAYIRSELKGKNNNAVIAELLPDSTQYTIMGNEYGYDNPIITLDKNDTGEVEILLPPDITSEFCHPYISSMDNLKEQMRLQA